MRINDYIEERKKNKKILIMAHQVLGYPDFETNYEMLKLFNKYNIDFVELQIPFSEPIADGTTFLKANQDSLANGTTVDKCFEFAEKVKKDFNISFLFMTYYNILVQYGIEKFIVKTKGIGFDGLIIPDATPENSEEYYDSCKQNEIDPILIATPYSSDERIKYVSSFGSGMLYCVPRKGVTGNKTNFDENLGTFTERCKNVSGLPVGVGFGIQKKEDIEFLIDKSDVAIIGSQFLNILESEGLAGVEKFLQEINSVIEK